MGSEDWIDVEEDRSNQMMVVQNGNPYGLVSVIWTKAQLELRDVFIWENHRGAGLGRVLWWWIIVSLTGGFVWS